MRDQGVHVIDLIRWFGGEPKQLYGVVQNSFWSSELDDNAFYYFK
jgi:predicted dehydrogenase